MLCFLEDGIRISPATYHLLFYHKEDDAFFY
jgi:hypothetical protein